MDTTGAGDTFCGATLAYLIQGEHPIMAARHAGPLATEMIAKIGLNELLSEDAPPDAPLDGRVQVDQGRVQRVAAMLSALRDVAAFPFVSPVFPPAHHPRALEYFFAATLQQFCFWWERNGRYWQPMIAPIGGIDLKGSGYLWEAFRRKVEQDAEFCSPPRQANLSREELLAVFGDDHGNDPMPHLDLHPEQARQYGRDMMSLQLTPRAILNQALESDDPLRSFMTVLDHVGGHREDPLRKKSSLLALILNQRPEGFLPLHEGARVAPLIDYHLMRSCLRVGLVNVVDERLEDRLRGRHILAPDEEWAVRHAAYRAIEQFMVQSRRSSGVDDWFFSNSRGRCPEMTEPECSCRALDPLCAHRKELFHPVMRTSFYWAQDHAEDHAARS